MVAVDRSGRPYAPATFKDFKMPTTKKPEPAPEPSFHEREAAMRQFEAGFTRSKAGNLWRKWDGDTVTVFKRHGRYSWVIATADDEKQYSPETFATEADALSRLSFELFL
jgi:hypothetical protein